MLPYDFLRGSASYEGSRATTENQFAGIQVWRPTLRGAAYWPVQFAEWIGRRHFGRGTGDRR